MSAESDRSESQTLPTRADLETLPRWARVAFAARCARRVQPLFVKHWPEAPKEHIIALDTAITLAERAYAFAAFAARVTAHATDDAADYAATTAAVANAAANAVNAAAKAAKAAYAAARAADAAANAADADREAVVRTMRRDFELLKLAAKKRKWTDKTPVAPEFFGPLWPEGVPEGWPVEEENSEGVELVVQIEGPPGFSDDELDKHVVELVDRIDRLHRSYGGRGVTVDQIEIQDPVLVEVGS